MTECLYDCTPCFQSVCMGKGLNGKVCGDKILTWKCLLCISMSIFGIFMSYELVYHLSFLSCIYLCNLSIYFLSIIFHLYISINHKFMHPSIYLVIHLSIVERDLNPPFSKHPLEHLQIISLDLKIFHYLRKKPGPCLREIPNDLNWPKISYNVPRLMLVLGVLAL